VILPIQQEEFAISITAEDQPDLLAITDFYQTGTGGFWVAKAAGRVVGTIGLKDIGNREAALRKMFVATDYRGAIQDRQQAADHAAECRREPRHRDDIPRHDGQVRRRASVLREERVC
jgi:hypothetical protein